MKIRDIIWSILLISLVYGLLTIPIDLVREDYSVEYPQDRAGEITQQVQQWSNELGIKPPNIEFTNEIKIVDGYGEDGEYNPRMESGAQYNTNTNTITFGASQEEHTVKHEFIHYLQDMLGMVNTHSEVFIEAQAYTLDVFPIETIMGWYNLTKEL